MKECICHFVKWQIHPFISKGTVCSTGIRFLPGHTGLGHPHEIHITGQYRYVGVGYDIGGFAGVAVRHQGVHYELCRGLPSHRLPKQYNSCKYNNNKIFIDDSTPFWGQRYYIRCSPDNITFRTNWTHNKEA